MSTKTYGRSGQGSIPGPTILLIESEPALRRLCERLMIGFGYEVLAASSVAAGSSILESSHGTVAGICCSIGVEGRAVLQLLQAARSYSQPVPVLLTSGYVPSATVQTLIDRHRVGFLAKPFGQQDLRAALSSLLAPADVPD